MLSKYSVKKPYTVVVAVVLVIILGVVSFSSMTVDLLPNMNLPYAMIMTNYQGASPEEVETTVTKVIEQRMATVSNIKNINSTSQENASTVMLEFEQTANMDSVTLEIRESLDQIKGFWPETVANPIIMKLNPTMMPVMVSAVSLQGKNAADTSKIVEQEILPELESLEGVASVSSSGIVDENIEVTVNASKIQGLNNEVKAELDQKFLEAGQALADAKAKVERGKAQLKTGEKQAAGQMGEAEAQLSQGSAEITQGQLELSEKISELNLSKAQLTQGVASLSAKKAELEALKANEAKIQAQYDALIVGLDSGTIKETPEILTAKNLYAEQLATLANYDATMGQIQAEETQLHVQQEQLDTGKAEIQKIQEQLNQGAISLAQARGQMNSAQVEATVGLSSGGAQLAVGEAAIQSQEAELEKGKDTAYANADMDGVLNAEMVKTLLSAQNFNMPAGYVNEDGMDYLVRIGDRFQSIEDISNLVLIEMEGIDPIKLSDVADVSMVNNSSEMYAKINGTPGIILSIQKQTGYSTGDVSKRILDKFEQLENNYKGLKTVALMDQGVYIDLVVNSVLQNLAYGAVLAILILLLFLRSFRPTLVIACSIPISILAAIVLMYFSGVTLNVISLSGLALGVGMLVDNSIVVIENIYRMRNEEGASAKVAAIEGARQVASAIAASTLTTICVFAPIVFAKGITRQLFVDMGLTIAYSLLASLVVALTLVPMMSAGLLERTEEKESKFFYKIQQGYAKLLRVALKFKPVVLIMALVLLIGSFALALSNGTAFMPEMESTELNMMLKTPEGTSLEDTGKMADQITDRLMSIADIKDVGAMASSENMMSQTAATNQIQLYAILKEDKKLSNEQLKTLIEKETKGLNCELTINTSSMDMSALGGSGIVVEVKGKEVEKLQQMADEVAKIVKGVDGTTNVSNGMEKSTGELRVMVDKAKATAHNLTVAQVYQQLSVKLAKPITTTKLNTEVMDYDILVLDEKNESLTRDDIKELYLTAEKKDGTTEEVALKEVATFEEGKSLQSINRSEQSRYINVTSDIEDGDNIGKVSQKVKTALKGYKTPEGYNVIMKGEDKTIQDSMVEVFKMLALAIVFMYLIMVAQFQSLRSPFIIMFTIPLAFTGGLLGLFLSGSPISVIAMIGFVMLSGIIVNNGIVFIDYTNQLIEQGMENKDALVEAGKTRLRPIIMTALTTILGLATMAMGVGMGSDMVQPMAIVTIGGLLYGTVLTLFVVPCIFILFHKKERKLNHD
ncbi:MAG: efflux RND transporter permease subunit [Lachnospiraceae bacterium]